MQTKNLIKIIKAEAAVLVSMIENLPDDGDIQGFEVEMLQNKINVLNDIVSHMSPDGQQTAETNIDAEVENVRRIAEEEAAKKAAEAAQKAAEEEARRAAEAEAAKRAEEIEKARKAAEAEAARKAAEELARKQAEEEAARKAAEEARRAAEEAARKAAEAEAKSKSLAEELANNTVNVEHNFSESTVTEKENDSKPNVQIEQPTTLADKFQQHVPSINDVLAGLEKKADIASRYNKRPITNLRKAIKINDRMLFINELFNHDSVQYEQTIDMIEGASGIDEVLTKIFSQYEWNQEDKTVIDFLELIYQRFKK